MNTYKTLTGKTIDLSALPPHALVAVLELVARKVSILERAKAAGGESIPRLSPDFLEAGQSFLRRQYPLPWRFEKMVRGPVGEVLRDGYYRLWLADCERLLQSNFGEIPADQLIEVRRLLTNHLRHNPARPLLDRFLEGGLTQVRLASLAGVGAPKVSALLSFVLPSLDDLDKVSGGGSNCVERVERLLRRGTRTRTSLPSLEEMFAELGLVSDYRALLAEERTLERHADATGPSTGDVEDGIEELEIAYSGPSAREIQARRAFTVVALIKVVEDLDLQWEAQASEPPFRVVPIPANRRRSLLLRYALGGGYEVGEEVRPLIFVTEELLGKLKSRFGDSVGQSELPGERWGSLEPLARPLERGLLRASEAFEALWRHDRTRSIARQVLSLPARRPVRSLRCRRSAGHDRCRF